MTMTAFSILNLPWEIKYGKFKIAASPSAPRNDERHEMKYLPTDQKIGNRGLPAGSPPPEREKNLAADAEIIPQTLRLPSAVAERGVNNNGQCHQHQCAHDIKRIQWINDNHKDKCLVAKKPHIHAPVVRVMPKRSGSVENFAPFNTGTTIDAKNTMPIFRNMSPINRAWLSDIIRSYCSIPKWGVKQAKSNHHRKKILATALGAVCLAVLLWGVSPGVVKAQSFSTNILGKAFDTLTAAGTIWLILYLLRGALSYILGLTGGFLDFAFTLNTTINPGQLAVVQSGWTVLRDLANGLFILILLWIAITIIFNLEGLGGKRLLVRVIIVALFINFSLVFVSTIFAFGNELAKPFQKAMGTFPVCTVDAQGVEKCGPPKATLSDLIVNNSRIHTAIEVIADNGALEHTKQEIEKLGTPQPTTQPISFGGIPEYLGAPQTAHAVLPAIIVGFFTQLALSAIYTTAIAIIGTIAVKSGIAAQTVSIIINLAIADGFLFLTALAMATAAIVLLLRLVAMVFLGVFAPIAFLGLAFPKYGERVWSQWIDNLIRWTFTAPIFYFLLYLSLLMLQINTVGNEKLIQGAPLPGNFFIMLNLVLFLVFLWAAVYMTKKTAGHFADVALSLGRKGLGFGLGVATGFVAKRALPKLGQWSEKGGEVIGKVESPFLRGMLRTPSKILRRTATAGRKQVVEAQGRIGSMTSPEIQRAVGAGEFGEADLAAAMLTLQSRGQTTPIAGISGYGEAQQLKGKDTIRRLGLDITGFLRGNPGLARPEDFTAKQIADELRDAAAKLGRAATTFTNTEIARRLAVKRIRPEHFRTMDLDIINPVPTDPDGIMMTEQFIELLKGTHFSELMRVNPTVGGKIQAYLDANPTLERRMDPQAITYFQNNAAQSFGWKLPSSRTTSGSAPTITPRPVPTGSVGRNYSLPLNASGGSGTYTNWRLGAGSPAGITIDPNTGVISWPTPMVGTHTISVEVDSAGVASPPRNFTITINP